MKYKIFFSALFCISFISTGQAAVFNVNSVSSFQNALNSSAANGENDTINVATGTYNVSATLTFSSNENHSLVIAGAGVSSTILDGGNSTQIMSLATTQPSADLNIRNLSFQNGNTGNNGGGLNIGTNSASITLDNTAFNDNSSTNMGGGASLLSNFGTISILNCSFRRNSALEDAGGLNVGTTDGTINLANSIFEDNTVPGIFPGVPAKDGGGAILYVDGNGQIIMTGNTFNRNYAADGGGGCMTYFLGSDVSLLVNNNIFNDNTAQLDGGGCFTRINDSGTIIYNNNTFTGNSTVNSGGGGSMIHLNSGTMSFSGNIFNGNTAGGDGGGGGAWIWCGTGTLNISSNTFAGNDAPAYNGGGAVILTDFGSVFCSRNIFYENTASIVGGGLSFATASGTLSLFNNTFYGNQASDGGGLYLYFDGAGAQATFFNNILWNDNPNELSQSGAYSVSATYSDIQNGTGYPWFGTGCIDRNPLFANPSAGDFHLTWQNFPVQDSTKSPCIDSGDPASPNDPDSTRSDMGALYFNQSTGVEEDFSPSFRTLKLLNPSLGNVIIEYSVLRPSNVQIRIFNVQGVLVQTLVDEFKNQGDYTMVWGPENTVPGVFFFQLKTMDYETTEKLVIFR